MKLTTGFKYLLKETGFELVRWETYSFKPVPDFMYNHLHFGTKARAVVRRIKKIRLFIIGVFSPCHFFQDFSSY